MKRSELGYNFSVNPFSSCAAYVFHHFAYIISETIVATTDLCRYIERYAWQLTEHIISITLTVLMY